MTAPHPQAGAVPWWQGGTGTGGLPQQYQPGRRTAISGLASWDQRSVAVARLRVQRSGSWASAWWEYDSARCGSSNCRWTIECRAQSSVRP
ncbi:hypothetical protein [Kitasatospora sp. NPDC094016]|uniref:hypothetical protein n=1 Tax=Kitasatospora sp. NPDC094016 TaxID=3154986 RepID=UPI0033195F8D